MEAKKARSAIYHSLVEEKGYKGTKTTAINYMNQLIDKFQIDVALYRSESEDTVENTMESPLSNGFVEGTNSRLKMIKRTMYGRANKELLEAKLIGTRGV